MDEKKNFSQALDQLILLLFDLRSSPKKIQDDNVLKKIADICIQLGKHSREMKTSSDESLIYDAHLIWNWLSLPFCFNGEEKSLLDAATEYQEKQSTLLLDILKQILADSEKTDLILGNISEISRDVRKITRNE